ncbi:hypothetical protein [Methylobacterium aquaticum]|uniref:Uncharacterized protein n=1 Tax=Methylobacterium aquaticum TaxID=270351 RepID=A0A0J6SF64_9HYPH|nr:hypothetical protein [Methylobacterium aquaticum]KMO33865.1 hypothetical protein VP06_15525 [Methylobacterium aquaticum]
MSAPTPTLQPGDKFGPWADGLSTAERRARLRCLRAIVHLVCGTHGADLAATLEQAEYDAEALRRSVDELGRLASLDRRKVLMTFAMLHRRSAQNRGSEP